MIFLSHLLAATGGTLRYQGRHDRFDAFSHDTRQLHPGELFVAVRGERFDGHDYVAEALRQGAAGLLLEARALNMFSDELILSLEYADAATIVVNDTREALQRYAHFILDRWHPTVIAVTGSVGKTSTKEGIATVLGSKYAAFRSYQNYNDLLGIPLSLGRLTEEHRYAVLELGCDDPGELANLFRIVRPQIGVLTNISPTRLQYFGSVERLAHEFSAALKGMAGQGGVIVLNGEDALTREHFSLDTLSAAENPGYLIYHPDQFFDQHVSWQGIHGTLRAPGQQGAGKGKDTLTLSCALLGRHHFATLLSVYTVASHCGMTPQEIQAGVRTLSPLPGRLNPLPGVEASMLLDDTHSAAPASVLAGLETLHTLPAQQRIAVLGDMLHLGDNDEEAHRLAGHAVARCADYLVTRGERAALIAEAARQAGLPADHCIVTSTHEDAAEAARTLIAQSAKRMHREPNLSDVHAHHSVLLIKGSEETRMERVTELLLAELARSQEQLVRQTLGWKQIVFTRADRPTWIEVDLNAIASNTRQLKALVGPHTQILVSLKADAYGHGAVRVARTTLRNGASMLGVATLSEVTPLRAAGITAPILIFGYVPLWQMREAVRQDATVTLYSSESTHALAKAAKALGKRVKVHLKVDTGMGRLGVRAEQLDQILTLAREITTLPELDLEGIYTHFANADSVSSSHPQLQLTRFRQVLQILEQHGLRPPIVHAANSAATLHLPEAHFDMVRPGIAIYGLDPSDEVRLPSGFRPALSFKTQVAQVKMVPEGECISYGCTYVTERPTRVATLPVGYADGFRRAPRNWGTVLVHGVEAPLIGRVCMDQCMIDVTHIPQTRVGDEVVLIGRQGHASLTAEQVAERLGTINYEVIAEILARVPRVD